MSLMHNGVASTFSIAYRESFCERGRVRKGAGAINAFTFGIGCISNAAAAFSSLPLSHSSALWWLCRCCSVFTYIAYLLKCNQEREDEVSAGCAREGWGEVRIKGALRKELKCNNSCCGHAQSVLYAAFVYLLTSAPSPRPFISFAFGMVRIC